MKFVICILIYDFQWTVTSTRARRDGEGGRIERGVWRTICNPVGFDNGQLCSRLLNGWIVQHKVDCFTPNGAHEMSALSARKIAATTAGKEGCRVEFGVRESERKASPLFMLIPFERAFSDFICRNVSLSASLGEVALGCCCCCYCSHCRCSCWSILPDLPLVY